MTNSVLDLLRLQAFIASSSLASLFGKRYCRHRVRMREIAEEFFLADASLKFEIAEATFLLALSQAGGVK